MNTSRLITGLVLTDILLFLSLPVIAAWNLLSIPTSIPYSPLQEEQRSNMAKFKGYEDTLTPQVYEIAFEDTNSLRQESEPEKETVAMKQEVPAVQSVAYTLLISNVSPTPTITVEPTQVLTVAPSATPEPTVTVQQEQPPVVDIANSPQSLTPEQITYLGNCEAGMDPTKNTGNGYYGAFQFSYGTWQSMNTGYERADLAPLEVQIDAVQRLLQRSSIYTQFPGCARKMQALGMI